MAESSSWRAIPVCSHSPENNYGGSFPLLVFKPTHDLFLLLHGCFHKCINFFYLRTTDLKNIVMVIWLSD